MTTKTDVRPDIKPTPIKPQVWACIYWVSPKLNPGKDLVMVGPDEWMTPDRFSTEELADEHALELASHCLECMLPFLLGHVAYLRAERLE